MNIPKACKRCWWQEGSQCFNKEIAKINQTCDGFQSGEKITSSFFEKCRKSQKLKKELARIDKEREKIKRDIRALKPSENIDYLTVSQSNKKHDYENHNCADHKELIAGSYELKHEDYASYKCRICGKTWIGYEDL